MTLHAILPGINFKILPGLEILRGEIGCTIGKAKSPLQTLEVALVGSVLGDELKVAYKAPKGFAIEFPKGKSIGPSFFISMMTGNDSGSLRILDKIIQFHPLDESKGVYLEIAPPTKFKLDCIAEILFLPKVSIALDIDIP